MLRLLSFLAVLLLLQTQRSYSSDKVTSLELQEDIQRFANNFIARVADALMPQRGTVSPELAYTMQLETLSYATTALDFASGPNPKTNLLDMMAFMTLTRQSIEEYWIPKVYKKSGTKIREVFRKSEQEIWDIAAKISSEDQRRSYMEIIQEWKKNNPDFHRTEFARLGGLYRITHPDEKKSGEGGILKHMESIVESTDEVLLLSQRAFFISHRMPFLLRLHARLAAREMAADTIDELARGNKLVNEMEKLNPFVENLSTLSTKSEQSLRRLENVLKETTPEKLQAMEEIVTQANQTTEKILAMNPKEAEQSFKEVRRGIERIIYVALGAALIIIIAWWSGYVWAKRKLRQRAGQV